MLVWFWIHRGPPLFAQEGTATILEMLCQEFQPQFKEESLVALLRQTVFHSTPKYERIIQDLPEIVCTCKLTNNTAIRSTVCTWHPYSIFPCSAIHAKKWGVLQPLQKQLDAPDANGHLLHVSTQELLDNFLTTLPGKTSQILATCFLHCIAFTNCVLSASSIHFAALTCNPTENMLKLNTYLDKLGYKCTIHGSLQVPPIQFWIYLCSYVRRHCHCDNDMNLLASKRAWTVDVRNNINKPVICLVSRSSSILCTRYY